MSWRNSFSLPILIGVIGAVTPVRVWADDAPKTVKAPEDSNSATRDDLDERADEFRSQVRLALRQPLKTLAKPPYAEAHAMVKLYARLQTDESLPSGERERFLNLVRTRLAQIRGAVVRGLRRLQTDNARRARRESDGSYASTIAVTADDAARSSQASMADSRPRGGNPTNEAQELIELIETTIAPATWEARGGLGVIKYWAPGHALVIRQTDDVHEQIGGVVGAARR